jgi:Flp pilus assembly pilin Flp
MKHVPACGSLQALLSCRPETERGVASCRPATTCRIGGPLKPNVLQVDRNLLRDESGQTMLEYIVIIVFSIIVTIIFFRTVKHIVARTVNQVSASCETD